MTGSPTGRRMAGLVLGGLLCGLALTGCTSAPGGTASPSPEVTTAPPSPSASVSTSSSASDTPSPPPTETSAVTIDITIADGQVSPNGEKVDVETGQTIVLNVTSDEHEEVHAHTDGDGFKLEVPAGKQVSGEFTIDSPGSYEVEAHHLEKVIVILNVR